MLLGCTPPPCTLSTFFSITRVPSDFSLFFSVSYARPTRRRHQHLDSLAYLPPPLRPVALHRHLVHISASSFAQPKRFPTSHAHWPTPVINQAGRGRHCECTKRKPGLRRKRPPFASLTPPFAVVGRNSAHGSTSPLGLLPERRGPRHREQNNHSRTA